MKSVRHRLRLLASALFITAACSRALTMEDVERLITSHPKAKLVGHVRAHGVSESGVNEALARVTIAGLDYTVKFRRFDDGWHWFAISTGTERWESPNEAIDGLNSLAQMKRAEAWVETHKRGYIDTFTTFERLLVDHPRKQTNSQALDAWGRDIVVTRNEKAGEVRLASRGPDGRISNDDAVCVATRFQAECTMPEFLEWHVKDLLRREVRTTSVQVIQ